MDHGGCRRGGVSLIDVWRPYWPVDPLQQILEQERRRHELIHQSSLRPFRQIDKERRSRDQFFVDQLNMRMLDEINVSLVRAAEVQSASDEIGRRINAATHGVLQSTTIRACMEHSLVPEVALRSSTARLAEISIAARTALALVPWNAIDEAIRVSGLLRDSLQDRFARFTESYARLYEGLLEPSAGMAPLPPVVWDCPPGELFRGVELLRAVTFPPPRRRLEPATADERAKQLTAGEDPAFEALLSDLDPNLLIPLAGARDAIRSTNPDRVRHFSISLRELFTQVLHRLAPDDAVKSWTSNPDHYAEGRPTRKARLLYVCRKINHGDFSAFLEEDVSAVLKFLNLFHGGTHNVRSALSPEQLHAMFVRMKGLLQFLLEIWRSDR
jgi:hypothetical protein